MAKPKKGQSVALSELTKESVVVRHNGSDVIVPTTKHETAFLNMLTASVLRTTIQEALKKWKDEGLTPTPKEIADLARAAKDIASLSMDSVPIEEASPEKKADPVESQGNANSADFSGLLKEKPEGAIEIETTKPNEPRDPSKTDRGESDPFVSG